MRKEVFTVALLVKSSVAFAQFSSSFIQNNSYWADGKAEFNIYDAQIVRSGQTYPCEALSILVREPFDPQQFVKPDDLKRPGLIPVLKLNQILHIPMGLVLYQQMHSNFWRVDDGRLLKFSLASNDSDGNTFKEGRRNGDQFAYQLHTDGDGMADGRENVIIPAGGCFYDELPFLVRTINFAKSAGEFEIQLVPTTTKSKKDDLAFKPAKVKFTSGAKFVNVVVQHDDGKDQFTLDREFPFLLREWNMADGGHLRLKRSLKIDYWNYNKVGDRERALANPMLRHPD